MDTDGCFSWCGQQPSLALSAQQYLLAGITCELTVANLGSSKHAEAAAGLHMGPSACQPL